MGYFFTSNPHRLARQGEGGGVLSIWRSKNLNFEGIARLKTMNMIINETLRLYPPVISLVRKVSREVKLGKLTLPAGVDIHIPLLATHHDTGIWGADALHFNPERFAGGVAQATGNNSAIFLPFGLGPRSCVGLNFATNKAKIALSMILQSYSFTLSPTYTHSPTSLDCSSETWCSGHDSCRQKHMKVLIKVD